MRTCSSQLFAILFVTLTFSGETLIWAVSSAPNNTSSDSTSKFDNVTIGSVLATVRPDVHVVSDNETKTSNISVAHISVGNRTELAVGSISNSSNVGGDFNVTNNITSDGRKKALDFFHNKGAMLRAFYVAVGILVIITIYTFVVSRLKRRKTKRHMYGLLTKHTDVELTPLGQDEEEEEHTVFDAVQYKS